MNSIGLLNVQRLRLTVNSVRKLYLPWLVLYIALASGLLFSGFSNWAYDDPFITYRYAENIADGSGFVYNAGQKVLSTTSPLFAVLLALLSEFWSDLPRVAIWLGALSLAVGALFLWDLAHTWNTPLAGWIALLFYPSFPLLITTLGSETPLYLAFSIGAFAFHARQRYPLAGLLAALAVLTRPDGFLVAVILAADYLFRVRRPLPWKAAGIYLVLTLTWVLFAWLYFGSPVPATLAAKQQQGAMAISQRFVAGFLTILKYYDTWPYRLQGALALTGLLLALWSRSKWLLFISWAVLYFLSYSVLGVSRYFWYYAPLVPGVVILFGLAIDRMASTFARGSSEESSRWKPQAIILLLLVSFLAWRQFQDGLRIQTNPDPRYPVYREIGEWLRDHTPGDSTVGAIEVGIIGYYAQRPMVDFAGLIQPEVARQLRKDTTYQDSAYWAIQHYSPDYIVLPLGFLSGESQQHIERYCSPEQSFSGNSLDGPTGENIIYGCSYP